MLISSGALALLTLALAWPVPVYLSRAQWPHRAPATALVVWQAVALAGGLSMIGALACFGLAPYGHTLIGGMSDFITRLSTGTLPPTGTFLHMFALSSAILLFGHLLLNLGLVAVWEHRSRSRHRALVDLLSDPSPDLPGVRLIQQEAPVAYCLPGTTRSLTVLSRGLIAILGPEQLMAVTEHERAHLRQGHHLVLLAFRAWRRSLPWFPMAKQAQNAVGMLVEMRADDRARKIVPDRTLASAITAIATGQACAIGDVRAVTPQPAIMTDPGGGVSDAAAGAHARVIRLVEHPEPLAVLPRLLAWSCAVSLLAVPTVLLVVPGLPR